MTSNVYFNSINPKVVTSQAVRPTMPVCGRGRHLLRLAVRDGCVQIASLADRVAIEPVLANGYALESDLPRGEITPTEKGRGYLYALTKVE
ncbi:hypothetical protein [Rhizobium sp. Root483D2]|uniref:hypothetical protein n=1 Tax=Rhizobium sp. Root483D2 TaxID=1736545 RepID=UPI0007131C44|nr:hypothetical protein [Rhizobium sp. Root483D2]KQY20766.1 hypothetical protein ASD32_04955 [Rhizobium sp. Root483D2]